MEAGPQKSKLMRDPARKAFDDGWSGIGSQALATTQAMGDAIVARWVSEGSAIADLTAWANRSDDTEEIEPMVQENRCYHTPRGREPHVA